MQHIVRAGRQRGRGGGGRGGGGGGGWKKETKRSAAPQSSGLLGFLDGYSQRLIQTLLSRPDNRTERSEWSLYAGVGWGVKKTTTTTSTATRKMGSFYSKRRRQIHQLSLSQELEGDAEHLYLQASRCRSHFCLAVFLLVEAATHISSELEQP